MEMAFGRLKPLNWQLKYNLEKGLKETIKWFK